MFEINVLSGGVMTAISGAAIWDYSDKASPVFLGCTNARGRLEIPVAPEQCALRILAYGHSPADCHKPLPGWSKSLEMFKIHPAAFTGFLAGSTEALWEGKDSGTWFQFNAFGYMRSGKTYKELISTEFSQYRLLQSFDWPPGPVAIVSGTIVSPVELRWSTLELRTDIYPSTGGYTFEVDSPRLRFPAPGKMVLQVNRVLKTEEEFKLMN